MTPEQQEQFRVDVRANPACAEALAAKDCDTIAAIMSVGRTTHSTATLGNGTILDIMGIADGNAFLDIVNNNTAFRYVKPLLSEGRLEIGKKSVQDTVKGMVSQGIITQPYADKICALGFVAETLSVATVHEALFHHDGTEK